MFRRWLERLFSGLQAKNARLGLLEVPRDREAASALVELGIAEAQAGRWDAAQTAFRDAITADLGCGEAHLHLGRAHARQGDRDTAVNCFKQAVLFSVHPVEAYCDLAALHAGAGNRREAGRNLELARGVDPAHPRLRALQEDLGSGDAPGEAGPDAPR